MGTNIYIKSYNMLLNLHTCIVLLDIYLHVGFRCTWQNIIIYLNAPSVTSRSEDNPGGSP